MTSSATTPVLRFDRFEVQRHERRLLIDGRATAIGPRAFDVLVVLAERAGELVSKDTLLELAWGRLVVEENSIQAQVSVLRKLLGREVIVTIPGRGYRLTARPESRDIVQVPLAPAPDAPQFKTNLPAVLTPLVGRERDLLALGALLDADRLVTIVGPGGMGKTVLAQTLLAPRAARFRHGVGWVDLAAVDDPGGIASAIAAALGLQIGRADPLQALVAALRPLELMLVLDNAEHLLDGVARVVAALAGGTSTRLVVTSQAPLQVSGEVVYRLDGLAVPADDGGDVAHAARHGAVALFVQTAHGVDRRFALSAANSADVVAICRQLDGLPLALQMAAARVPALGVVQVREALAQRFRLLTSGQRDAPARQRTLLAALDWSHTLLGADERKVLRRLGVFAGGFSLALATTVAADEALDAWAVTDLLASLIGRSLVAASADEPPRYALLDSVRAYALDRLLESGEETAARSRHARALIDWYEFLETEARRLNRGIPDVDNQRELDNAIAAYNWALVHEPASAVALAALTQSALQWSRVALSWRWFDETAPHVNDALPCAVRVRWACANARVQLYKSSTNGRVAAHAALATALDCDDDYGEFNALAVVARSSAGPDAEADAALARMQELLAQHPEWPRRAHYVMVGSRAHVASMHLDRLDELIELREQELALIRAEGAEYGVNAALTNLVVALSRGGRGAEAIERGRQLAERLRHGRDRNNFAYVILNHVSIQCTWRDFAGARADAPEALELVRQFDLTRYLGDSLARIALHENRPRAAARLYGWTEQAYSARGEPPVPDTAAAMLELEQALRERLDATEFQRLRAAGGLLREADLGEVAFGRNDE